MKIIYKNFLAHEVKELEHFLLHMTRRGYSLTKTYGGFLFFQKKKKPCHYYVLGSEVSNDVELKYSLLTQSGYTLIGQNGKMAIFMTNDSNTLLPGDELFGVKKSMRRHLVMQAIYIVFAIMLCILKLVLFSITGFSSDSIPFFIFLLGTLVLVVALLYFIAELHTCFSIRPPSGERSPFSRILFTIGDTGVLTLVIFLLVLSIVAAFYAPLEYKLSAMSLWIFWPLGVFFGSIRQSDFICALAWIAILTYSVSFK